MSYPRRGRLLAWFVFCVSLLPTAVDAQTARVAWDGSAGATGYVIRWGTTPGVYPNAKDAGGATESEITGLTPGAAYWAIVEAYDAEGTFSDPSAPLAFVAPLTCTYAITPPNISISAAVALGTIFVATPAGCPWTATTATGFISFSNGAGRVGPGSLTFTIDRNLSTSPRVGTAVVAGQTFTVSQTASGATPPPSTPEGQRADFDGDGKSDILLQDTDGGHVGLWALDGTTILTNAALSQKLADPAWRIAGTGDFNGDNRPDIVWHHPGQGYVYVWFMDGVNRIGGSWFSRDRVNPGWRVAGIGDFNGDGQRDIVWQHDGHGRVVFWLLDGVTVSNVVEMPHFRDTAWRVAGVADFTADGQTDLLLRHSGYGELGLWRMNGTTKLDYVPVTPRAVTNQDWQIASIIDANGDGSPDLVWHNVVEGWVALWHMNGVSRLDAASLPVTLPANWRIAAPK